MFIKIIHNYFRNLKNNREEHSGLKVKVIFIFISKITSLFIFYFLIEFSM